MNNLGVGPGQTRQVITPDFGGGGGGGMDDRITRLESHAYDVAQRLSKLDEKVDNLPRKSFIVWAVGAGTTIIAGLMGLQTFVQSILAASP
jgi:hypothetical protein